MIELPELRTAPLVTGESYCVLAEGVALAASQRPAEGKEKPCPHGCFHGEIYEEDETDRTSSIRPCPHCKPKAEASDKKGDA